jgi:hypothetical protein
MNVSMDEFIGEHVLSGVDFDTTMIEAWGDEFEQAEVMRFRLDGVIFAAIEDPDDGYRSCLGGFEVSDAKMGNIFEGVNVIGRIRTKGEYGDDDEVIEFIDCVTGLLVLEAGTTSVDAYYPCYCARFSPENMAINANKKEQG